MGKSNEVEYYLDPTAVRIWQELAYLHPDKVNNDGVLTSREATDLFDRDGDRQITGQEIFTTLRPLSGFILFNYNDVVGKQLTALFGKNWDADFDEALKASGENILYLGTEIFVSHSRGRLHLFNPISELESTDLQREWDAEEARQKIEEILGSRGVSLPNGTELSEEASNLYVDWFLSSVPIMHSDEIGMALLKRFPNMGSDRRNFLLDSVSFFIKVKDRPFEALPLLDAPLTPHQREMIGHLLLAHGTDADVACLEQKDPDLVSRLRARFYYSTKGYVRDLGRHHFVDRIPSEAKSVAVHVHPFFSIIETHSPRSRSELIKVIEKLAREGKFFQALDLYQELKRIEAMKKSGVPVLFVLGRYLKGTGDTMKRYTALLKDIFGTNQNYYFIESEQFADGTLIEAYREEVSKRLKGKQLTFSGGYVGRCLERAVESLKKWRLRGTYDVAGSSVQEGDHASVPSSITDPPRFDDSYASLDDFFEAHNEMVWEYDDSVDWMLHVGTECVPSDR